jgi:CMP/dCMP kinase
MVKITVSGSPGSGKSVLSKYFAEKNGLKRYNIGELRRQMALERGITLDELNKIGEKEAWTDKYADDYQRRLGQEEENFIIEGTLSWYFIPDSIKIFVKVDSKVAAERIFKAKRESEKNYSSIKEAEETIIERINSDKKRYGDIYGVDPYDLKNYDIIIDTSDMSEEDAKREFERVIKKYMGQN